MDHEDEDLQMALRMSMNEPPEPKRSKPRENSAGDSPESGRKSQRELMAAAAEKRMMAARGGEKSREALISKVEKAEISESAANSSARVEGNKESVVCGSEISAAEAAMLFSMVFGEGVSKDILAQWSNQGIRFSSDTETSMGLVQHEGGPCGVLATIQAFLLKHLLFAQEDLGQATLNVSTDFESRRIQCVDPDIFASLTEERKLRALIRSLAEMLFLCGNNKHAAIASLSILDFEVKGPNNIPKDEIIGKALEGLSLETDSDFQKVLRVTTYTSMDTAVRRIEEMIPLFQSRMGAMLFLISALLSRGLEFVQADRDDPSQPLVTAPFGHASQEIVNLLLSGQAVANVFDGRMDLGGGMFVNGISTNVEVGFLTLLESLNFCKVGQHLKCPKWPIWVVGSESHYTVLFALDTKVQEENELEGRETQIRRAFDAQDQSGGGGFISVEGLHQVLRETNINLPSEKLENLSGAGFIVWNDFWQVLLNLDKNLGGVKDSTGLMGKKVFDLYHFNGIAKSVPNGSQGSFGGEIPIQRPRLTRLKVSVPPRWTPEEFMADGPSASATNDKDVEVSKSEPAQHAPLVDCIRTRWPRAVCNWQGDSPSIV
ncbi:hypothetical protein ACET3Z_000837 [Daucus carota]